MPSFSLDFTSPQSLIDLGFSSFFADQLHHLSGPVDPARVVAQDKGLYHLAAARGPLDAVLAGRFAHDAISGEDLPAVGDWVGLRPGEPLILHRFERRTVLARKEAGRRSSAQVIAANVDVVFLVTALDGDFNERRLERYLALVRGGGARPVIVLNKADLCPDPEPFVAAARAAGRDAQVVLVSARWGESGEALSPYLARGETAALVGSSGVGKSTLTNMLLGEDVQAARDVRDHDRRGRHTTTRRTLFALPCGALLIDTPGMRELSLVADEPASGFDEITDLAAACRFRDCAHRGEPGCAVASAIDAGELDPERLAGLQKLEAEAEAQRRRQDPRARIEERRKYKAIQRSLRASGKS